MLANPAKYFDRAVTRCLAAPTSPPNASRSVLPGGCVLYRLPLDRSRHVPASSRGSSWAVDGMGPTHITVEFATPVPIEGGRDGE
jgi:hypothetical protein